MQNKNTTIIVLPLAFLLISVLAIKMLASTEQKQTSENTDRTYVKYTLTKEEGKNRETKTTQTLYNFPSDPEKSEYACYEVCKNGLTGHWDDSEFSLVKECDYKKDRCFAVFERDKIKYYGVVLVSSSVPDFPSKMIIVPQNVYDELSR